MTDAEQPLLLDLVRELTSIIGRKLTAYAGSVRYVRDVDRWIAGEAVDAEPQSCLYPSGRVTRNRPKTDSCCASEFAGR